MQFNPQRKKGVVNCPFRYSKAPALCRLDGKRCRMKYARECRGWDSQGKPTRYQEEYGGEGDAPANRKPAR
jgi:hypothetical protein